MGNGTVELILLVMVAGFLVLRLRSVLGKRIGFERTPAPVPPIRAGVTPVVDGAAEPVPVSGTLPAADTPAGQALAEIARADPAFTPKRFLTGAEAAFRIIVDAFASGDRDALRPLLDEHTFTGFDSAISAREAASETQKTDIRAIRSVGIEAASLARGIAQITVRFVSDQVSTRLDRAGAPVHGADAVTELTDLWTFERDLGQSGPAWRLTDARPA